MNKPNPREGSRPQKHAPSTPTMAPRATRTATPYEARKAEQASAEVEALRRRVSELEGLLEAATAPAPVDLGDAPERPGTDHANG